MTVAHPAGPKHDQTRAFCFEAGADVRRIRSGADVSPLVRALARAIHNHAISHFEFSCSQAAISPALCVASHDRAARLWLELTPSLRRLLALTGRSDPPPTGPEVLSAVADELKHLPGVHPGFPILNAIWRDVFTAYSLHLWQWIARGVVQEASKDFFVVACEEKDWGFIPGMPTRHYFRVESGRLPSFISSEVAERVFYAGHVVNCIGRLYLDPSCHVPAPRPLQSIDDISAESFFRKMREDGSQIELVMESASLSWRKAASAKLSSFVVIEEICVYLRSLREYLLLGNEPFWHCFFRQLRRTGDIVHPDMTSGDVEAAEHSLNRMVECAMADSEQDGKTPCILELKVLPEGQLAPQFAVPFPTSALISDSASKYSRIFAMAFAVRRVSLELEESYHSVAVCLRKLRSARISHVIGERVRERTRHLRRCAFIRMRMSRLVQAFDDFLQADVFETGYRELIHRLWSIHRSQQDDRFDEMVASHRRAVGAWETQSLSGVEAVQRRLDEILEACLGLCVLVKEIVDGQSVLELTIERLERGFTQNAQLLVRVLSGLQGRAGGSKVSVLLMRADWDGRYARIDA